MVNHEKKDPNKLSPKCPSYQQAYLDLYKVAFGALIGRLPFGVAIEEDQQEEIAEVAEGFADAGMKKLLECIPLDHSDNPKTADASSDS